MGIYKNNLVLLLIFCFSNIFIANIGQTLNSDDRLTVQKSERNSGNSLELLDNIFNFTNDELSLLDQNEFLVINRLASDDIQDMYDFYWQNDLPLFISTDTVLHVWHLLFDKSLEYYEKSIYYPLLETYSAELVEILESVSEDTISYKQALIYANVAAKILNPEFIITDIVTSEVNFILEVINAGKGFWESYSLLSSANLQRFVCDYSQFKPRGHYTNNLLLQRYFKAYKWYSKIPFFFEYFDLEEDFLGCDVETMVKSSLYLIWSSNQVGTGTNLMNFFDYFVEILVGKTHKVSHNDINYITQSITQKMDWKIDDISDAKLGLIIESILKNNSISSPISLNDIHGYLQIFQAPKTYFMFGESLSLDSYALEKLVWPFSGERYLPKGLDLPAACFNSQRALYYLGDELAENKYYKSAMESVQEKIENEAIDNKQSLNWQWIESLRPLSKVTQETKSNFYTYPEFMKNDAWLDEKLTTVMGSWTQLKHDMVLYSKIPTCWTSCSTPFAYVEPYPDCYSQLANTVKLYTSILEFLTETFSTEITSYFYNDLNRYIPTLNEYSESLEMLSSISLHQLKGIPLNTTEKQFLIETYSIDRCVSGGPIMYGWLGKTLDRIVSVSNYDTEPNTRASLVADIHTDSNTGNILHSATGLLENIIVKVPGWLNEEIYTIGPVFSYYEFILPNYLRFNDDDWRSILNLHLNETNRNNHDFSHFKRANWVSNYMISTTISKNTLYNDTNSFNVPSWFYKTAIEWENHNITIEDTYSFNFTIFTNTDENGNNNAFSFLLTETLISITILYFIRRKLKN